MRTGSQRLAGTLLAFGFVGGWLSASWVSPPTVATQAGPPRTTTAPPVVALPRIALDVVTAPRTTPATARNPFTFSGRLAPAEALPDHAARAVAATEAPLLPAVAEVPTWRVFGIASEADGRYTAVVSGGGDVFLLALGDRLPDDAVVAEVNAGGVVLVSATGERLALRLP